MPVLPTPDLLDSAEARPNSRCVHGLCRPALAGDQHQQRRLGP